MKKHIFWRLFSAAVLSTVVWSATGLDVYGGFNDSSPGGTLLDIFRGRSSASNSAQMTGTPTPAPAPALAPAPQMTNVPAPQMTNVNDYGQPYETIEGTRPFPGSQYVPPASSPQQPAAQNKWSLKNWLTGAAPVKPQTQYVEPAPPLEPAYKHPHSPESHPVMPRGQKMQYPVVPLDSKDFIPQEGAIYNEKGEMIFNPESGGPLPEGADGEVLPGSDEWNLTGNENMQNALQPPTAASASQLPTSSVAAPYNESDPGAKRIIMGSRTRQSTPLNQERVFSSAPINSEGVIPPALEPMPAPAPINPYAQQPTAGAGKSPARSGNSISVPEKSNALKLDSGSNVLSKTYQPINRLTGIPKEPVMDIAEPDLADALPQESPTPPASPVIEELHNVSPLENLSDKSAQTPTLEPVPESVPEIDVPKERLGNREQGVGNSDSPKANLGNRQEAVGSSENTQATNGSESRQTRGSADGERRLAASQLATPLVIEIDGPDEVEFGKNEMFSLSVINTTDAVRRDVDLSVHPEGFGDDKTASLKLEQLSPGEKKSVYMKLNARQYNNLSLTAHVRDALGFETTKTINVNVKNESVKISILPPQAGNAYVGQPTQYIVRIVNNGDKAVAFNAMAFFGNGIEPIRATGAPNTIQSGQVVVNNPIELKQGEMRDLKIIAVALQPGIHKILVQLIDSRGATYAAKESCAYRQREFNDNETETAENDARIELMPGKSEIGVWKAASAPADPAVGNNEGDKETVGSSEDTQSVPQTPLATRNSQLATPDAPALNAPDAVPLTQPDQGPKGDLIMPMFAQ